MSYRLGVDVGGTFTDVLLVEEGSGRTWRAKTASTPADQSVGVLTGIGKACAEAGIELSDVASVLHGTTVATNAILEGKGATVGLVTTKGFRQVLQIARSFVPGGLAGWRPVRAQGACAGRLRRGRGRRLGSAGPAAPAGGAGAHQAVRLRVLRHRTGSDAAHRRRRHPGGRRGVDVGVRAGVGDGRAEQRLPAAGGAAGVRRPVGGPA
jgi:hypothetical protein